MARDVLLIWVSGPNVRGRLTALLGSFGHHLVFALDLEDGLARLGEARPDLVLVDTDTPGVVPSELVLRVRSEPEGQELPVVAFGPGADQTGADHALVEPLHPATLWGALAPLLAFGRPGMRPSVMAPASASTPSEPARPWLDPGERSHRLVWTTEHPDPTATVDAVLAELDAAGVDDQTIVGFASPFYDGGDGPDTVLEGHAARSGGSGLGEAGAAGPGPNLPSDEGPSDEGPSDEGPSDDGERATEVRPRPPEGTVAGRGQVGAAPAAPSAERSRSSASSRYPGLAAGLGDLSSASERSGLEDSQLGQRLRERVESLHAALDHADAHQLLGIDPTAEPARIEEAWWSLALELHPDRFFLLPDAGLKRKLYAIHHRLREVQRELLDPARRPPRTAPGGHPGEGRPGAPAPDRVDAPSSGPARRASLAPFIGSSLDLSAEHPAARAFARRAEVAFRRGDLQEARFHLHAVLACEAENPSARRALDLLEERLAPRT